HFFRQGPTIAMWVLNDGHLRFDFPGDAYTVMETFDPECFTVGQEAFTVTRDHLIECDLVAVTVDIDDIALETLAAFMKGDDQGIMAFHQQPQVGGDFQRRSKYLRGLRNIFRA